MKADYIENIIEQAVGEGQRQEEGRRCHPGTVVELLGRAASVGTGGGCTGEARVHWCAQCAQWTVTLLRELG